MIAIEPSQEMLTNAWKDYQYTQIMGDVKTLSAFADKTFDIIICHNVLEYVDDKAEVIKVLTRVLKQDGILSIVKHNRPGRVMQMAVLLYDFEKVNAILDGKNSTASKFGTIRYYENKNKVKEYSKGIYVKFKPEEVEILHDRMQEAGVQNMSAYIRKMAINGYVIIPEWPDLNRVISLQARISNNLNQYAKKANEPEKLYEEDIAEIKKMNNEQTDLLKKALEAVIHLYEEDSKKRK